jgi:hypothetical protein
MQVQWNAQGEPVPSTLSPKIIEALDLLQEECAEVIQERSKLRRFGPEFRKRGGKDEHTVHELFQREIWDVLIMIDFLEREGFIDTDYSEYFKSEKYEKLQNWTTLFEKENNNERI